MVSAIRHWCLAAEPIVAGDGGSKPINDPVRSAARMHYVNDNGSAPPLGQVDLHIYGRTSENSAQLLSRISTFV